MPVRRRANTHMAMNMAEVVSAEATARPSMPQMDAPTTSKAADSAAPSIETQSTSRSWEVMARTVPHSPVTTLTNCPTASTPSANVPGAKADPNSTVSTSAGATMHGISNTTAGTVTSVAVRRTRFSSWRVSPWACRADTWAMTTSCAANSGRATTVMTSRAPA